MNQSASSYREVARRVLLVLGATIALVLSVGWFTRVVGFWSWASALCATWFAVVWVTVVQLLTGLRFPEWYCRPKNFERFGRIYELLGVPFFRRLVRRGPIHLLAPAFQYSGRRELLPVLERETRTAEAIHVLAFFASLPLTAYALSRGWLDSGGWLLSFTVLLNVYPLMLQRHNRVRLQELIQKRSPNQQLHQMEMWAVEK
jgi:hypothetical protein